MTKKPLVSPELLTRRNALIAGGVIVAAGAAAAVSTRRHEDEAAFLKGVDIRGARALGDGFYEVDGWVLTADDVRRLGGKLPDAAK